jgi:ankyrin repeat protein
MRDCYSSACYIRILLDAGAVVNYEEDDGQTPLFHAIRNEHTFHTIKQLIDAGADMNTCSPAGNALDLVLEQWSYSPERNAVIQYILKTKPNIKGALYAAAACSDIEKIRALLDSGTPVDSCSTHGYTALTDAALNENYELTEFLLNRGVNVEGCTNNYCCHGHAATPLQVDSITNSGKSDCKVVEMLLDAGADVNADLPTSYVRSRIT